MTMRTRCERPSIILPVLAIVAMVVLGGARFWQLLNDPQVPFLVSDANARWIKTDAPFILVSRPAGVTRSGFRVRFETTAAIEDARLVVRAMKQCLVMFDGRQIYDSPDDMNTWKQKRRISIPSSIQPGTHELVIVVDNRNGPAAVLAYSKELGVRTGGGWEASIDGKKWTPAQSVCRLGPVEFSLLFPTAMESLLAILPWMVFIFALTFTWTMLNGSTLSTRLESAHHGLQRFSRWYPRPHHIRWVLVLLWLALGANNMFKLPAGIGFDLETHIEYFQYIAKHLSLPLATDGWQMFQSPLYYIVSTPFYVLFSRSFSEETVAQILRFIPLICGLVQIEIVYRSAKLVFPDRNDLQSIATVTGGLMPVHTYICQLIGNEPFAGWLTSLTILLSLGLLTGQAKRRRFSFFVVLGFVWGLAMLSKVTAVLLALPVVIAVVVHSRDVKESFRAAAVKVGLVLGACFVTSGWYYIRNWIELGKPFIGGWELSRRIEWWQDPGYRTLSQLVSFGESLIHPIYSGTAGFWDAIYSSLWLDGFISGVYSPSHWMPWNEHFVLAGALLAIVPTILLLAGVMSPVRKSMCQSRKATLFSIACVVIYLGAILDLYIRLPIYSTAKASYTLGLLPCYGLLMAAGAEPFLHKRIVRSFIMASIACWAFAAVVAYFV